MNYPTHRRADLLKFAKSDEVDTYYIAPGTNAGYFSGLEGAPGALIVNSKRALFISDDPDHTPPTDDVFGPELLVRDMATTLPQAVAQALPTIGAKVVGFDADCTTVADLEQLSAAAPKLVFKPLHGRLAGQRAVKDPAEVERIRAAVKIGDRAFSMFRVLLHEGDTEKEMADALDGYVRRAGGRASAYPARVFVGERSAVRGAVPSDRKVSDGSKFVAQWGADVGYKALTVRTLRCPFAVTPTRRTKAERVGHDLEEVAAVVLESLRQVYLQMVPELTGKEVYEIARAVMAEAGYADKFCTLLGHGVGLDAVEGPFLSANSTDILRAGMVFTVVPSITIPDWGAVRIGGTVLLTREGPTVLSELPEDPAAFE